MLIVFTPKWNFTCVRDNAMDTQVRKQHSVARDDGPATKKQGRFGKSHNSPAFWKRSTNLQCMHSIKITSQNTCP
ncbi:hypothetical protein SKAU_G00383900 [Synaphobranchus kaupii]|uniref:Uncharacterized protein n=1 Tax=Synaphobranchus kaupii TaxID=118154 RepID=A0A9Q1IE39_SYNKA|nr:hypothetical protein SKAU_G00383900 [Synaphobranchus kaupii]